MPGLLQTSAIMAFQSSLSSVLLMSSLLGDSFFVSKLFRQSAYFLRCLPLLLVPLNLPTQYLLFYYISSVYMPKNCSGLFLMVLSRDRLNPAISITSSFDFFSVHDILIILLMYHISAASSLLSRSFVSVRHSHPFRKMDHM